MASFFLFLRRHGMTSLQVAVFADASCCVPTSGGIHGHTMACPYKEYIHAITSHWGVFFLHLTDIKTPKNSHENGGVIPENSHERALLYTKLPNTLRRWIFTFHRLFYAPSLQCPTEIAATLRAILREAVAVSKQ